MILGTLLGDLASLFVSEKIDDLRVAYMDPVGSVPPPLYFPSRYQLSFVLFSNGNFFPYQEEPTLKGLVKFIAAKSRVKMDAEDLIEKAAALALKNLKVATDDNVRFFAPSQFSYFFHQKFQTFFVDDFSSHHIQPLNSLRPFIPSTLHRTLRPLFLTHFVCPLGFPV